jgi:multiple sugar transport system substrate-binding protein
MTGALLRGLNWGHRRATGPMEAVARRFAERGLGQINWDVQPLSGFEAALGLEAAATYDLIVFDHPFCGAIAAGDLLLPLNDAIPQARDEDFVGRSLASYRYDGRLWGLPVDGACQVSLFRADLLDAPVPSDWLGVLDLGRSARRQGRQIALAALNPHGFLVLAAFCANLGGAMTSGDPGERPFPREVLEAAIAHLEELFTLCDSAGLRWNAIDLHEAMIARDDLVFCPAAFSYATYGENDLRRRLGFADFVGPAGAATGSVLGGTGLGVTQSCRDLDAARALLRLLADHGMQRTLIAPHHGQPAMTAAWDDATADAAMNYALSATRQSMERASMRPRFEGYIPFQHRAGQLTEQFLGGTLSASNLADLLELAWRECASPTGTRNDAARTKK